MSCGDDDKADFEHVLDNELRLLMDLRAKGKQREAGAEEPNVYKRAHAAELTGLAFSGGGIRSATFNLGVIIALAQSGVLSRFDYLSTVSGGGYIGGWLSALLQRHAAENEGVVDEEGVSGLQPILTAHPTSSGFDPPDETSGFKPVEHAAIRYLRRYTAYLIPRAGLSGDLLAVVSLFLRNLLLIQFGLVFALATVLLFGHWIGLLGVWISGDTQQFGPFIAAVLALFIAVAMIARTRCLTSNQSSGDHFFTIIVTMLLGAFAACFIATGLFSCPQCLNEYYSKNFYHLLGICFGISMLVYTLAWVIGYRAQLSRYGYETTQPRHNIAKLFWHFMLSLNAGFVWGLLVWLGVKFVATYGTEIGPWYGAAFGPPIIIVLFLVVITIHIGTAAKYFSEQDREWFARLGGWLLLTSLAWTLLFVILLYAPPIMHWLASGGLAAVATWLVGSGLGAWMANSEDTSESGRGGWKQTVAAVAPWLFVLGLGVLVAYGVHSGLLLLDDGRPLEGTRWELASNSNREAGPELILKKGQVEQNEKGEKKEKEKEKDKKQGRLEGIGFCNRLTGSYEISTATSPDCEKQAVESAAGRRHHGGRLTLHLDPMISDVCPEGIKQQEQELGNALKSVYNYCIQDDRLFLQDKDKNILTYKVSQSFAGLVESELVRLNELNDRLFIIVLISLLILLCCLLFMRFFDINLFSLHTIYRNRLDRAYLGASRSGRRQPNPITGFDPDDDIPFHDLKCQRPIPIINTTVNMTGGDDLAWQTRRGASFAFTPCWAGFETKTSQGTDLGCYRPTNKYCGGLSLATLIAVSGAAASPNMGYHSRPAIAALLTAFNLRLGRWCGNPNRDAIWEQSTPRFAAMPILAELTGTATGQADWVNLSDGGHFENLGIYELVRRRCRLIVVSDASCDPAHTFSDLASAIRKCWTDFGVEIEMPEVDRLRLNQSVRYCPVRHTTGRIRYPDHSDDGLLVYLKASLDGKESVDIREYVDAHPKFPHESTADQFFDEDQFEAYRQLGIEIAEEVAAVLGKVWRENGWPPDYGAWPHRA